MPQPTKISDIWQRRLCDVPPQDARDALAIALLRQRIRLMELRQKRYAVRYELPADTVRTAIVWARSTEDALRYVAHHLRQTPRFLAIALDDLRYGKHSLPLPSTHSTHS